jgi:hypothetical protein
VSSTVSPTSAAGSYCNTYDTVGASTATRAASRAKHVFARVQGAAGHRHSGHLDDGVEYGLLVRHSYTCSDVVWGWVGTGVNTCQHLTTRHQP